VRSDAPPVQQLARRLSGAWIPDEAAERAESPFGTSPHLEGKNASSVCASVYREAQTLPSREPRRGTGRCGRCAKISLNKGIPPSHNDARETRALLRESSGFECPFALIT
jgi:hypothetical protein